RMSNAEGMTKLEGRITATPRTAIWASSFGLISSFVIRTSLLFPCFRVIRVFRGLKLQALDVFDIRCLAEAEKRNHDRKSDGDFGRGHGDDEENKNLGVVIWDTAWIDMKSRERDQGQIGGVQHQLQRHQNDDHVASHHHAGESDREQDAADNEIIAKCDHVIVVARESRE